MPSLFAMLAAAALQGEPVDPPIALLYEERPPYQMRNGDAVEGVVGAPSEAAFKSGGVAFRWEASSQKRMLTRLRENREPVCVAGFFKNQERLAFAKFTKPVYRDRPVVALVRRQFAFGAGATLADALSAQGLRLLVRRHYSYGQAIDGLLKVLKPVTFSSPLHNVQLVELLKADRADMLFAAQEEAALLLSRSTVRQGEVVVKQFSDAELGEARHIVCSFKVPDDTIKRLNKGIPNL